MTTFLDGPAKGKTLMLRRAVLFLRVVVKNEKGKDAWDACDQAGDEPSEGETIFAYICEGRPSMMHMLIRGKNKHAGGMYAVAEYKHVGFARQPAQSVMRTRATWEKWVEAQPECAAWPR